MIDDKGNYVLDFQGVHYFENMDNASVFVNRLSRFQNKSINIEIYYNGKTRVEYKYTFRVAPWMFNQFVQNLEMMMDTGDGNDKIKK